MKKLILLILVFSCSISLSNAQQVNGDSLTIDGKLILRVWGNHYERGCAHGYLMGDRIKDVFDNYVIGYVFQNNAQNYASARAFFEANFEIETKYVQEVEGMFQGMDDAGIDLYNAALGRELDITDVLMGTALGDLNQLGIFGMQMNAGCSTISSWGLSTARDPQLNGNLVVTRQFDWYMHSTFLANHMMIIHFPSESDEVAWINFGIAGCLAPFSALNELGMAAFINTGNYQNNPNMEVFHPICLSIRNGLEIDDYDGDLNNDHYDVAAAISDYPRVGAWIITSVSSTEGIIIECNNENGVAIRTESDNTVIPENNIVATNHFRLLYPSSYCSRYNAISDSLNNNANVTVTRSWEVLCGAAGVALNVHTVGFAPTIDLTKWSTAPNGWTPAYTQVPTTFDLDSLFDPPLYVIQQQNQPETFSLRCFPNPFNPTTTISFQLPVASLVTLNVFDINGRNVGVGLKPAPMQVALHPPGTHQITFNASGLSSGIYIYRLTAGDFMASGKMVLMK